MKDFEEKMINSIQCAITNQINKTDFIQIPYNEKVKLPDEFLAKAWDLVDQESLLNKLSKRLESELVDRIVNHMAAEIATDIKQLLSVKERREAIRALARDNLDAICKN